MTLDNRSENINIMLNEDEAIVLFEWLSNFNAKDNTTLFEDQAEQRVLFNLETELEKNISSVFDNDYKNVLLKARDNIRDKE